MKKHKTNTWGNLIEPVEVERETKSSVWINGRRHAKMSEWHCYFDTFDEAKSYLVKTAESEVSFLEKKLELANDYLSTVKKLEEQ